MNDKAHLDKTQAPASPATSPSPAKQAPVKPLPADAMIIIPMRNTVLFPGVISPITVGRIASVAAAQEAVRTEKKVGFLLQRDPQTNEVKPEDLYWVGTAGQVVRYITGAEGTHHLVVQGQSRFRVLEFLPGWPYLVARVQLIEQKDSVTEIQNPDIEARFLQLKAQAIEAIQLLPSAPEELTVVVQGMTSPALLADMVANLLDIKNEDKQDLLETFDLKRRLDKVLEHLCERVGVLRISKEIGDKTKKEFDERQREHVLREQMRQIQKELGEGEDTAAELEELKKAIDDAGMPEDVHKHAVKELKRLQRMGEGSAEGSMLRTYLEWLAELPWKDRERKNPSISRKRGRSSTRTTSASTRSSAGSSSTSRCASSTPRARARFFASSARRGSARPRSASRSRAPPGASSSASRSAACTTRPRSAATAAPTSARCPAT